MKFHWFITNAIDSELETWEFISLDTKMKHIWVSDAEMPSSWRNSSKLKQLFSKLNVCWRTKLNFVLVEVLMTCDEHVDFWHWNLSVTLIDVLTGQSLSFRSQKDKFTKKHEQNFNCWPDRILSIAIAVLPIPSWKLNSSAVELQFVVVFVTSAGSGGASRDWI